MLNYHERGSGLPVIWIHGFPLSRRIFDRQLAIAGVRHILPDLPGFGETPPSPQPGIAGYAALILNLMDGLGLPRAVLAGLSMGGYILLSAARQAPERLAGAILIDTRETPDSEDARRGRFQSIEQVERQGIASVIDAMLPKMLTEDASEADRLFVRETMQTASAPGVVAALRAMADRPDATEDLRSLRVPVLIAVGDRDTITTPEDASRMAAIAPDARLALIGGAAHLSNVQQPAAFNEQVRSFLAERVAGSLQG
jgi:3-oxoadipate enol-lactonase